jgi:hypothetical protein
MLYCLNVILMFSAGSFIDEDRIATNKFLVCVWCMEVSSSDKSCESELWLLRLRPLSSLVLVIIAPDWFSVLTLWILIG